MSVFQHERIRFFYEDIGDGIPIVFIHPPGMGRKVFYFQKLLAKKFRVLLIDLSGHGDTIGSRKQVSIDSFASEIKAFLQHLSIEKAVVCGYSSGGFIAQQFALTYPAKTKALILIGGFPKIESLFLRAEHYLGTFFIKHFPNVLIRSIAKSHTSGVDKRDMLTHHMQKANRKTWFQFYKQSQQFDCVQRLKNLQAPLLLLYGAKDFINQHAQTYRKLTTGTAIFIKNAGHQIPFKNWRTVNAVMIRFLHLNT